MDHHIGLRSEYSLHHCLGIQAVDDGGLTA
jgi:hypothetical protein